MQDTAVKEDLEFFVSKAMRLIYKFDPTYSEFICWEQQFIKTVRQIKLPIEMKVPLLLKLIERYVLSVVELGTGLSLTNLRNLPYEDIAHILQHTFMEVPIPALFRTTFLHLHQIEGESVKRFARRVEMISAHCEFETHRMLIAKLRFTVGLRDGRIQDALNGQPQLSFEETVRIAEQMESPDIRQIEEGALHLYPEIIHTTFN